MGTESEALQNLKVALETMKAAKPAERSELARSYAVAITDLEKLIAYYCYFVESEI